MDDDLAQRSVEQLREALQLLGQGRPRAGAGRDLPVGRAAAGRALRQALSSPGLVRSQLEQAPPRAADAFARLATEGPLSVEALLGRGWWGRGLLPPPLDWLQRRAFVGVGADGLVHAVAPAVDGYRVQALRLVPGGAGGADAEGSADAEDSAGSEDSAGADGADGPAEVGGAPAEDGGGSTGAGGAGGRDEGDGDGPAGGDGAEQPRLQLVPPSGSTGSVSAGSRAAAGSAGTGAVQSAGAGSGAGSGAGAAGVEVLGRRPVTVEAAGAVVVVDDPIDLQRVLGIARSGLREVAPTVAVTRLGAAALADVLRAEGVPLRGDEEVRVRGRAPTLPGTAERALTPWDIRAVCQRSIDEGRQLHLLYYPSSRGGAATERTVDPWTFEDDLLVGWCHLRTGVRTFAIDRVGSATLLPSAVVHTPDDHPDDDPPPTDPAGRGPDGAPAPS